jgi:hypothetical protein
MSFRRLARRAAAHRLGTGVALAFGLTACLGGGGGGGDSSTRPREGELCEAPDNGSGKACVGTVRFDCEEEDITLPDGTAGTESRWAFDDDCADEGLTCQDGACVAGVTPEPTCANVAGSWRFDVHCDPAQVGRTFTVVQTACDLVSNDGGFEGKVKANGDLKIEGTQNGQPYDCEGTVNTTNFTLTCTGSCAVTGTHN